MLVQSEKKYMTDSSKFLFVLSFLVLIESILINFPLMPYKRFEATTDVSSHKNK